MNCKDIEALIPAFALDALSPEEEQAVESHPGRVLLVRPVRHESIETWPPPCPWPLTRSRLLPESSPPLRNE